MTQITLLSPVAAPVDPDRQILVGDATDLLPTIRDAGLVVADPPWLYQNNSGLAGSKTAEEHYDCLTMAGIIAHLDQAYDSAADDCYLLCWATWPTLVEAITALPGCRWEYVSGGCWTKWGVDGTPGSPGIGYHWRGDSEPLLMLRKGSPKLLGFVRNADVSPRTPRHSEKPVGWLAELIAALCPEGGTVLELYGGMCPTARAARIAGRRCVSIEIDPVRAEEARALLAQGR